MAIKLYELTGANDNHQFSPYCWRIRMALAHKGLAVETIPWRFTEKDAIAFSGQGRVPVMVDGENTVADSWDIAQYLEQTYPDRPSLFGSPQALALARFVKHWDEKVLIPVVFPIILMDVFNGIHDKDKVYFRTSREKLLGQSLEDVEGDRTARINQLRAALAPMRETLTHQAFLAGEQPNFADHIVFARCQFARLTSSAVLLANDDPIYVWRDRMLDQYGGMARGAKGWSGGDVPT